MIPAFNNMFEICHLTKLTGLAKNWQGLFVIACSVFFLSLIPAAEAEEADLFEQQKISSHLLINLFLEKLDQNALIVFEQPINRSDLKTHQVAYVHTIADDSLFVRLCFKLQKKILVPNFENYYVDGLTIETDTKGNIIQVKTHVSPVQELEPRQ